MVSFSGSQQIDVITPVLADDGVEEWISLSLIFPEAVGGVWH